MPTMRHLIFLALLMFVSIASASVQTIHIGVLALRPADAVSKQYAQTVAHLNARIPGYNFEVTPLSYLDFDSAIKERKIDLVFTNPEHFIHLKTRYSLTPILTIIAVANGHPVSSFGGVIFTKSNNNKINYIEDINGKVVASPTELSLGGYLAQKWELYKKNIHVDSDCKIIFTSMPHDNVVTQVMTDKADVGFVRTGILESLAKEGKLNLADIKIINKQAVDNFPQLISTEQYPEWPIAITQEVPTKLSKAITTALLDLSPTSTAAIEGQFYGFSPPSDYNKIESLMIRLQAISDKKSFDIGDVLEKYSFYIISALAILLSIGVFMLYWQFESNKKLKKAAVKIKKMSEHESSLLVSLGEGVYGVDTDGNCTFVNDAALKMLGFSKDEVLNTDQHKLFHHTKVDGSHYGSVDCPISMTLNDGSVRKANEHFITKDGKFLPVSLIVTPVMQDSAIVGAVVSFQDISTQKALLSELKDKEIKWHALFENNAAIILVVDSKRNIIDVNIQFCTLFGHEKSDIIGQHVRLIHIDDEHYNNWAPKFQSVKNGTEEVSHAEYPLKKKSGEIIWLTLSGARFDIHDGEKGVVWSAIDITERKEAEEELRRLNSNLESKVQDEVSKNREKDLILLKQSRLAAIGEMVSNIAHQWRQPLNALAIRIQDVHLAFQLGEVDGAFVNEHKRESMKLINYMSQTIEDFRNFFKPDKQKEPFSVLQSVEDAYSITKDSLKVKSIHVGLFEYNDQFFALGYKNEFAQVVLNIIFNAADALMQKPENDRSIMIDISKNGDFVKVTICDNAGGIPIEIMDNIFDPYFTTKHKSQGTGLGLYMSKMIIEQNMNGKIQAYNTDRGACFTIEVPSV